MRLQCSTCLERMCPEEDLGCTPCGHVFHMVCVLQWFENKKNCPQCRTAVKNGALRKIFLTDTEDGGGGEVDLQGELDSAKLQLRLKETERAKLAARNKELEAQGSKQKEELKKMEVSGKKLREQYDGLRSQKMLLQGERARAEELEQELRQVRNKLETFKGVEVALRAQEGDLNQFLHERGAFDMRTKDLANLVIMMKQKLAAVKVERSKLEAQLKTVESQHASEKSKVQALETKMVDIKAIARNCQTELEEVRAENIDLEGRVKRNQTSCQCAVGAQSPLAGEFEEAGDNREVEKREDISEKEEDEIEVKLPTFTSAGASQKVKDDDGSFLPLSTRGILSQLPRHVSEQRSQGESLSQHYNGLGGREREMFQTSQETRSFSSAPTSKGSCPKTWSSQGQTTSRSQPLSKFPSQAKIQSSSQPVLKKRKMTGSTAVNSQMKTIDKFFGGFDTP